KELRAVGRHLQQLKRDGYDTITALCEFYNVYSDVLTHAAEEEFKTIQRMAYQFTEKKEEGNIKGKVVNAASMVILSQVVGAGLSASIVSPGVDMSSNMGSVAE